MHLDHVVLWVTDPVDTAEWLIGIAGFEPVRLDEYKKGDSPFPSLRVNEFSIIDLCPIAEAADVNAMTKNDASAGFPVNHVCIALESRAEYERLASRFEQAGVDTSARRQITYGARAWAPEAFYITDKDHNSFEFRYYGAEGDDIGR
ncbi:MAG TPA: VOC family protein [Actinospica sp.]|jgi:catechol 2,3-dioxygenase-like lactoylglutathione lyase family enzyme|nr:VOC family protein [Actinospica sp.]